MMLVSCWLAVLAGAPAASPPQPEDPCAFGDNRCKARQYLERARTAASPRDRAVFLFGAHRLYLHLFDETSADADLCASRRAYDRSLAVKNQPRKQRANFAAQLTDLAKREGERGMRCGPKDRTKPRPNPVTAAVTPGSPTSEPASSPASTSDTRASTRAVMLPDDPTSRIEAGPDGLMPIVAGSHAQAVPPPRLPVLPREKREQSNTPPGRVLLIGGGTTLAVGLALTGVAGYMGGRLLGTWRASRDLHDAAGTVGTVDQAARDAALASDYQRLRAPTLVMALVGGSTLVVGAVLVGVGARRLSRVASRAALLPTPGGVVFRARF